MNIEANIDFWIKNSYNVLFKGAHGVGKTSLILDAFKRNNLKWQYFSASTMDPWVDFVGIPKEKTDDKGVSYLELVRPKNFQNDEVEAIFLDEYNRSSKKIRNSVMELIQFKSINGKKFNNLKIVWVAINPDDDEDNEYDVEKLDPAQLDRFHAIVDVPNVPSVDYFRKKFGNDNADVGITWWKELPKEQKKLISPRRLDYALDMYSNGGDIRFVLPKESNINKLLTELQHGSISKNLKKLYDSKDIDKARNFLAVENNYQACWEYLLKKDYFEFFIPALSDEKLVALASKNDKVFNYIFDAKSPKESIIKSLQSSGVAKLSKAANHWVKEKERQERLNSWSVVNTAGTPAKTLFNSTTNSLSLHQHHNMFNKYPKYLNSYHRQCIYGEIELAMPQTMMADVADFYLKMLITLSKSSQPQTIMNKMPKLPIMINHVLGQASFKPSTQDINKLIAYDSKNKFGANKLNISV